MLVELRIEAGAVVKLLLLRRLILTSVIFALTMSA